MGITTNNNKIATKGDCYTGLRSAYPTYSIIGWSSTDNTLPTRSQIETAKIRGGVLSTAVSAQISGNYAPNQCVMTKDITFKRGAGTGTGTGTGGGGSTANNSFAYINTNACIGCGDCIRVCPTGAISVQIGGLFKVNQSICNGCGACFGECPNNAIEEPP